MTYYITSLIIKLYFNLTKRGYMPKIKKTNISLTVESEIWNKTKGYSEYIGLDKGDIVGTALKLYFKSLDEFEKKIEKERGD